MPDFELLKPKSLADALELLEGDDPDVRPMSGGTALALMMKANFLAPARLVSLARVTALYGIAIDDQANAVRIGAMTTFTALESSSIVRSRMSVIHRAMRDLANVRVRNVATVGGNLAHADPHLDLPPIWAALGAEAILTSRSGNRRLPVEALSLGYYETCIEPGELITEVAVPLRPHWRSTYVKVTTRAAHDWPALGIAISANFEGLTVVDCRIVLSAATDWPIRLIQAEKALCGADVGSTAMTHAADAAVAEASIQPDSRGTSDYKNHLLRVHLDRAFRSLASEAPNGDFHAHS